MEDISKEKPTRFQLTMILFYTAIIIAIITIDFVLLVKFNVNSNVILHNPVSGSKYLPTFTAAGYAWDRDSILRGEDITVTIIVARHSDGKSLSFDAKHFSVHYKDKILFHLSTFSCPVTLPEPEKPEDWNITARMTTHSGYSLHTKPRRIRVASGVINREFRFFSFQHIIALVIIFIGAVVIFILFRKSRNKHLRTYTALFLSLVLIINELAYHIYWDVIDCWIPTYALMLHMCGMSILILPYALFIWKKKIQKYLAEITYFWGLGGALQALLSPDINVHGFPEYKYFSFFISHGLIIITALFIILAFNIRIGLWSYIRAFCITNATVILLFIINPLFKYVAPFEAANYWVVGYPPPDGSIVDLFVEIFGPSPWYVIGLELMGIAVFAIVCVPFIFMKKKDAAVQA